MVAQPVGEHYIIQERLGTGGMGVVYRGIDVHTGETVAIKSLKPQAIAADPGMVERFSREADALRRLNHPNIVKVLATFEDDEQHFIVMEYISGGSLYDLLKTAQKNRQPLPIGQILSIALDVSDALTRAHRLNIIHRDIKPANVLLAADGTPRLTDFGLAFIETQEHITNADLIVGTPDYLSPEMLNNKPVDTRADIWALGVMLFEMLAGQRPFVGKTLPAILASIVTHNAPDLETLRPDAPVALVDLIYRMLEKEPDCRIASVRLVGAELEAIMRGRTTTTFQVVPPPDEDHPSPPPTPTPTQKHNLPIYTTPFVGRESELTELDNFLADAEVRLITILAPGGMGKTRLALEVARRAAENLISSSTHTRQGIDTAFKDGVYLVLLAPLTTPESIIPAIAEAVGYRFQQDKRTSQQQLIDFLGEKTLLLVMDNFEHLVRGAEVVADILQAAPGIKVLATSRERLALNAELVFNLGGMDFPEWETPEDALEYSAVKLFLQGARRAQPGFELKADDLSTIAGICRLVEGMPLGILLAAAWVEMLSPQEIVDEIGKSIDFLTTTLRDMPERHRSIQAVFDYSWNMLTHDERAVFCHLSLFRGGFTREAAQQITGASLRTLMSLISKSLLRRSPDSGRYEVHELLRQYGEKRLESAGETTRIHEAHSRYYLKYLREREADLKGRRQVAALDEIEAEFENIRNGWLWAVSHRDEPAVCSSVEALRVYCDMRGSYSDGEYMLKRAHERFDVEQRPRTWAMVTARYYWFILLGDFPYPLGMFDHIEQCVRIARESRDKQEIAFSVALKGVFLCYEESFSTVRELFQEALTLYRELNQPYHVADVLTWIAITASSVNETLDYLRQAVETARTVHAMNLVGWGLINKGIYYQLMNRLEDAEAVFQEALRIQQNLGDRKGTLWSMHFLSRNAFYKGEIEHAQIIGEDLRRMAAHLNNPYGKKTAAGLLGLIYAVKQDDEGGWTCCQDALEMPALESDWRSVVDAYLGLSIIAYHRGDTSAAWEFAAHGFRRSVDVGYPDLTAAYTVMMALLVAHKGETTRSAELLSMALNDPACPHGWLENWTLVRDTMLKLQAQMGAEAYTAACEYGKTLDLVSTVQNLLTSMRV